MAITFSRNSNGFMVKSKSGYLSFKLFTFSDTSVMVG